MNKASDTQFRKAIMSAMPHLSAARCPVSEEDLFKAALTFQNNFRKEIEKYEASGRSEVFRPNMKQKSRVHEIERLLSEYTGIGVWPDKAPVYQVYFIVGVLMSLPYLHHDWWEETFAKGIWEYLGWTADFKDSDERKDRAIKAIMTPAEEKTEKPVFKRRGQNIYVASSWRNRYFPEVVKALRDAGHNVYDFRNPPSGEEGFHWTDVAENCDEWTPMEYRENLSHPLAERQFRNDFKTMQAYDICVLLLPCGHSAHVEAGWFAGKGKKVYVLIPDKESFEPELMYKLFTKVCVSLGELLAILN